jgi:hypothetical protein
MTISMPAQSATSAALREGRDIETTPVRTSGTGGTVADSFEVDYLQWI